MNRLRRWWLRNFVYGRSLYDFAVLTVQREDTRPIPPGGQS